MKQIMLRDFQKRDQMLKKMIQDEQKEYVRVTKEMEEEILRLEQELKKKMSKQMEEKVRLQAEALQERLILQQRKHFEVTRAMESWTKDVTDANAFAKMMDQYQYALTTAPDLDQWLEEYRKLLQDAIPKFLYDWYNTTGAGCLDPEFEEDFTVAVELAEVAGANETLSEKCESPNF
jgi:Mg2+ and Co2+ transporter CorA